MLRKKHLLLTLLFFLWAGLTPLLAQEEGAEEDAATEEETNTSTTTDDDDDYPYPSFRSDEYSDFVPQRRQEQQDKFLNREYPFPAKPRDKWELGLTIGPLLVSGDVKTGLGDWTQGDNFIPKLGWGGHIRKSFGYVFSLRGNFMMGTTWGRNWQQTNGWSLGIDQIDRAANQSLAGNAYYDDFNDNPTPNYMDLSNPNNPNGDRYLFYNYKTNIRELSLSGIVNLNNIRFHKRETKVDLYGLFGLGGVAYRTFQDQLDGDGNLYNYTQLIADLNSTGFIDDRDRVYDALDEFWDGDFESQAERHFDDHTPFDDYSYKPTAHVGLGMAFKLGRRVNLGVESRVTYTNDDLLDGQRWQEWGALTRDYDTYTYTGLHLNVNLGGKNSVEPLWWMNPLDYAYEELAEAPCCDSLPEFPDLADDDNDGVPNAWDEEPDSREDCPVDTRGRMIDSDRDGVLDCDDKEPHTAYDRIDLVDEFGVAPPRKIKCSDIEDICACIKGCRLPPMMPDRPTGPPIRPYVPACVSPVTPMPSILFDLNKYSVKPGFKPQLRTIADIINNNPGMKHVAVVGHTDVRSGSDYNRVLSYKRAKEVIDILVRDYGVDRNRLVLQYRGEDQNAVSGLSDSPLQKGIDADQALNRRVEFVACPVNTVDMPMPAGPRNAGSRKPRP